MVNRADKASPSVGYRKPPVQHRFKKGISGNPNGRKKGTRNFSTDVKEILAMQVSLEQGGKSKSISTQQASLRRLLEKALKGDSRALDRFLKLAQEHGGGDPSPLSDDLPDEDLAILEAFVRRVGGRSDWNADPSDVGEAPSRKGR